MKLKMHDGYINSSDYTSPNSYNGVYYTNNYSGGDAGCSGGCGGGGGD